MIQLSPEFKQSVLNALASHRQKFDGSDVQFAKQFGINGSIYSRIKNGENTDGLLREAKWLEIGQKLDVHNHARKWVMVETEIYQQMHESAVFCQTFSKSFMLVDDPEVGKTFTAKYLSRTLKNSFYIDGSQAKGKTEFIRLFARTIGVSDTDKIQKIKDNIKYVLKNLPSPLVFIDEAGDLDDKTFLEVKELWNATEGLVGWYMIGAEGLQEKVERNINNRKPGFAETFSRFGSKYNKITPTDKTEKQQFYRKMLTDVLLKNVGNTEKVKDIVQKCLRNDNGKLSGLRRAETLAIIHGA